MYVLPNATAFNNACASASRTVATKCEIYGDITESNVGSFASFETGVAKPLSSLKVELLPIQDLSNGDPSPTNICPIYPYGRNLCSSAWEEGSIGSSGTTIADSSSIRTIDYMSATENTTYTFSCKEKRTEIYANYYNSNGFISRKNIGSNTTYGTFTTPSGTTLIKFRMTKTNNGTEPMAQFGLGSNVTPYVPYNTVTISRTSTNIWNGEIEQGTLSTSTGQETASTARCRNIGYIPIVPSNNYYCKADHAVYVFFYDKSCAYLGYASSTQANKVFSPTTLGYPTAQYIRFRYDNSGDVTDKSVSINYPSTDHNYHAYNGTTYSATLPQLVYGGTLDVVSGKLTVTMAIENLGDYTWTASSNNRFITANNHALRKPPSSNSVKANIICTNYATQTYSDLVDAVAIGVAINANSPNDGNICIRDTNYSDANTFKTAMDGVMLCYELRTPTVISLTPQQIKTLVGQNNIWADGNNIVQITYNGATATMKGDGINGEIISMEWDNIVCSNDGLQIGTACMDEFKMTYRPVSTTISLMGKEILPYVGLEFGTPATTTYVPLGVFNVTDVSSEDEDRTFNVTAYDGMQFLMGNADWTSLGVTFPINAWTLLEAIASHFNLTLSYTEELYRLLSSDDYILTTYDSKTLLVHENISANKNVQVEQPLEGTYRDYIGWIAGLVGANAHMGRNGDLVIARYTDHGFTISRDVQHMGNVKINYGGSVTYTSIISGTDENPVYPTNYGGNAITYSNPFIDVAELDLICDEIVGQNGITVTPCDATWRSNPCIDAGDIVGIEDKDGNISSTYVMERVVNITGGLSETLYCYGETEIQKALNKSPLVTKLTAVSKTAKEASDYINNTEGTFEFIDNGDGTNGGFTIYENGSSSWLRCTAGGLGISADGGLTYTNAITKNGVTASQIYVRNNGREVLRVYYDENAEQGWIRLNNPVTGVYGYDVSVTQYGSGLHLLRIDNGEETIGLSTVGNTTSANAQIHIDDPDTGFPALHFSTYRQYSDGFAMNSFSVYEAEADPSDPTQITMLDAISQVSNGNIQNRFQFCYANSGDIAFRLMSQGANDISMEYKGQILDFKTFTVNGTTYHCLGYT